MEDVDELCTKPRIQDPASSQHLETCMLLRRPVTINTLPTAIELHSQLTTSCAKSKVIVS